MKYAECYKGNFIEAADLSGKSVELAIERVEAPNTVKCDDGRVIEKPVVYFTGAKKGLILNKTNAKRIILFYCPDKATFEEWAGTKITLHNEDDRRPDMGGKRGPCVRVKIPNK